MERMVRSVDQLAKYDEFCANILPGLQLDLKQGFTPEQILKKYESVAAAALVSQLVNPLEARSAAKEILDRRLGRPTERKEIEHKFSKLTDIELDAILVTELSDVKELAPGNDE